MALEPDYSEEVLRLGLQRIYFYLPRQHSSLASLNRAQVHVVQSLPDKKKLGSIVNGRCFNQRFVGFCVGSAVEPLRH